MFVPRRIMVIAVLFSLCAASEAYDVSGHHYTLNAIFSSAGQKPVSRALPEQLIQIFCAELPDLSLELDAITQRNHVLFDPKELLWGAMGQCNTAGCAHMVATQFYLHGLTGTDTAPVRSAAENIIRAIDAELKAVRTARPADMQQQLVNLWCERGLAAHLLGDTFAHSVIADPQRLYLTGLGHTRDKREPDFMLARDARLMPPATRWSAWVQSAAANLSSAERAEAVVKLTDGLASNNTDDHGEKLLQTTDTYGDAYLLGSPLRVHYFVSVHAAPSRNIVQRPWVGANDFQRVPRNQVFNPVLGTNHWQGAEQAAGIEFVVGHGDGNSNSSTRRRGDA